MINVRFRLHLMTALCGSGLLIAALELMGVRPRPAWFVALGVAAGIGSFATRLMFQQVLESSWPTGPRKVPAPWSGSDDKRTRFLATWIRMSSIEPQPGQGSFSYVEQIQPLLSALARDRLIRRHGLDPYVEPERARDLAGEQLWALLTDHESTFVTFAELELAVRAVEEL